MFSASNQSGTRLETVGIGEESGGLAAFKFAGSVIFVDIKERHREVTFHRGVEFVLGLHPNGISRGVGFKVESGGGLEGAVGLKGEEGIVGVPCSAHEVVALVMRSASGSVALKSPTTVPMGWFSAMVRKERWKPSCLGEWLFVGEATRKPRVPWRLCRKWLPTRTAERRFGPRVVPRTTP